MKTTTLTLLALLSLVGCTENQRAKKFGGKTTIKLPPNTKLVNATWKESSLWYLYRPSREGESPETLTFKEDSSFGLLQGEVVFQEQ